MSIPARRQIAEETYQAFLLFCFPFSLRFAAFFNRPSSSCTLTPSMRASAFSHCSRSWMAFRFSSGIDASFSLRDASCARACVGLEAVLMCVCAFLLEPGTANATFAKPGGGCFELDADGWSGTRS